MVKLVIIFALAARIYSYLFDLSSRVRTHGLSHHILHHPLDNGLEGGLAAGLMVSPNLGAYVALHALFGVLGQHVDLDVDRVPGLLARHHDLLLRVGNEHDLEPAGGVVHLGDGQARAVDGHVALEDYVAQHVHGRRAEAECLGVAVLRHRLDGGRRVDVALHKVAAHAGVGPHGALEVHARPLGQGAQIRQAERLGRDADGEARLGAIAGGCRGEGGRGQADAVDGDAVAQLRVGKQDRGSREADGQGGAAGGILGVELGDFYNLRERERERELSSGSS